MLQVPSDAQPGATMICVREAAAAAADMMAAAEAEEAEADEATASFDVEVPAGACAGQTLLGTTPKGGFVRFTLPAVWPHEGPVAVRLDLPVE